MKLRKKILGIILSEIGSIMEISGLILKIKGQISASIMNGKAGDKVYG